MDQQTQPKTLLQLYTPVFAMISALEVSNDYGDPEGLAEKTLKLLDTVREESRKAGKSMDWVSDVQYAVIAFVDESINRSEWHGRAEWQKLPLAARLGMQPNTGVVFFEKFDMWMRNPTRPKELLEVFYVCLGLGFQGQYFNDQNHIAQLKRDVLQELTKGQEPSDLLSPQGKFKQSTPLTMVSESFPWIWFLSGALGFLLLMFVILKFLSIGQIDDLVEKIGQWMPGS